jgi:hypothetical protein
MYWYAVDRGFCFTESTPTTFLAVQSEVAAAFVSKHPPIPAADDEGDGPIVRVKSEPADEPAVSPVCDHGAGPASSPPLVRRYSLSISSVASIAGHPDSVPLVMNNTSGDDDDQVGRTTVESNLLQGGVIEVEGKGEELAVDMSIVKEEVNIGDDYADVGEKVTRIPNASLNTRPSTSHSFVRAEAVEVEHTCVVQGESDSEGTVTKDTTKSMRLLKYPFISYFRTTLSLLRIRLYFSLHYGYMAETEVLKPRRSCDLQDFSLRVLLPIDYRCEVRRKLAS